ncbi:MAG: hypothetical protein K0R43_831 [Pseudoduganella sp.]|jgi:general secretion pathway protein B|nr:hypothetical protein [Pseudoduganella sp.]
MSYILEALKKAQAERQIGSTPTIHAPTLAAAPAGQGRAMRRAPVIVAMVLMAAAIAGLAAMLVRQRPAASPAPEANPAAAMAPATPASVARPAEPPAAVAPAPVAPAPVALPPEPVAASRAIAEPKPSAPATREPPPAPAPKVAAAARAAEATPSVPATPAPPPAAPVEEHIQSLQELPEPIQRAIPPVALGGYMYSKNPADRLLLIDKVLRKEGEEVAPGLLLEKLQPKQAVFRFRGYRYRVPL